VALEVGIVGLPASGKTTLFTALTKADGGEYGKTNVGMANIADVRLEALADVVAAKKVTPAAIRVQDVPGTGPALLGALAKVVSAKKVTPAAIRVQDAPGTGPALLGNLRQVDALLVEHDEQ